VYTCYSKFTAEVPLCRELHGHLITAHHLFAFSTFWEGWRCGGSTNKRTNKEEGAIGMARDVVKVEGEDPESYYPTKWEIGNKLEILV